MHDLKIVSQHKCFEGMQYVYSHFSEETKTEMRFGVYIPPLKQEKYPCLYWLSGLTCTEQNFLTKAGAQQFAAKLGVILIVPDTSPRGLKITGDKDSYDFGEGAGFYLDAQVKPWAANYRMDSYIKRELYSLVLDKFNLDQNRIGIFGHSMGGLGALNFALKNPNLFHSVSAFAPICAPQQCAWGEKAFMGYLGDDKQLWDAYDPLKLIVKHGWDKEILIDQGTADEFIGNQLNPHLLQAACANAHVELSLKMREGYDHTYYFIASFIEEHFKFHLSQW